MFSFPPSLPVADSLWAQYTRTSNVCRCRSRELKRGRTYGPGGRNKTARTRRAV